jgi:hypothetical protein
MTLKSAQLWCGTFATKDSDGLLSTATVGPVGALYVDGVSNAAAVTISGANPYKFSVTLPALTAGQTCSLYVTATVATVATGGVVAQDVSDTKVVSGLNDIAAGALMGLSDDAITSAKFDESSAFPLKAADALSTQVARVGADGDTLEALSDQIDNLDGDVVAVAAQVTGLPALVWSYATRTLTSLSTLVASIAVAVWGYVTRTLTSLSPLLIPTYTAGTIPIIRGDSMNQPVPGLGDISTRVALWFSVKHSKEDSDPQSIIQIREVGGLLYLNGGPGTVALGSLTVTDQVLGNVTIILDEAATMTLEVAAGLFYDFQWRNAAGDVHTLCLGTCNVVADVTRVIV